MSLPRYPEYKESGIGWVDCIPSHWTVMQLGQAATERCDGPFGSGLTSDHYTDRGALVVRLQNIKAEGFYAGESAYIDIGYFRNELTRHAVIPNDLLIAGLGDDRNLVGRACVAPAGLGDALVKADCFRFRLDQRLALPAFAALQLTAGAAFDAGTLAGGTTRSRIPLGVMASRKIALPPIDEQSAIASFLDRETAKIDALIAEQEKLIALLAEKRQATISHAVTRGLDPDVPKKDSTVPWIGEVPAHWEVAPLKRFWSVTDCKHLTAEFVDDGYPLASIREVQSRYVALDEAKRTTEHFYVQLIEGGRKPLPGDLIFSRNATVGEVAQVAEEHPAFAMGQDVCLLRRLDASASPDYLQDVVRSGVVVEQLKIIMVGSTFKRVNVEEIRCLVVPMPPSSEQRQIAEFLKSERMRFEAIEQDASRSISLLRERRSALITAAVTGQIDVRGTAQAAPASPESLPA